MGSDDPFGGRIVYKFDNGELKVLKSTYKLLQHDFWLISFYCVCLIVPLGGRYASHRVQTVQVPCSDSDPGGPPPSFDPGPKKDFCCSTKQIEVVPVSVDYMQDNIGYISLFVFIYRYRDNLKNPLSSAAKGQSQDRTKRL